VLGAVEVQSASVERSAGVVKTASIVLGVGAVQPASIVRGVAHRDARAQRRTLSAGESAMPLPCGGPRSDLVRGSDSEEMRSLRESA
jgi:hypothetical protein